MLHDSAVNILVMSRDLERPTKVRNRDTHCFYRRWSSTLIPSDDLCIRLEMVNFELKQGI